MYNVLKFMLFPYFCLGMVMAVACSSRSAWHPGLSGFAVLGAIHVLLSVGAYFLAAKSKENGAGLSPSGLGAGFVLAYAAGFVIFLFV
jgi:hypothetical protein